MDKEPEKEIFRDDAKRIVDTLFDAKLFNDEMTRDKMKIFEDLLSLCMQSKYASYVRGQEFLDQIKPK